MDKTKKQVLPNGLWVVATPIGNLEDLSSRAISALKEADGILCEDTRETSKLLSAFGISKFHSALERLDAHSSSKVIERAVERLCAGESLALVTDAGTPAISDPGAELVDRAREQGVRVIPIPGPSALMALLSVCGFHETSFVFRGFFPRKQGEQKEEILRCYQSASSGIAQVYSWFESPHRIVEALDTLVEEVFRVAPQSRLVVAKELTKIYEKIFGGTPSQVRDEVKREIEIEGPRGEWCFALQFVVKTATDSDLSEEMQNGSDWVKALHCLIDCQVPASSAARQVSQHFGVSKKRAYEKILQISGKKNDSGY